MNVTEAALSILNQETEGAYELLTLAINGALQDSLDAYPPMRVVDWSQKNTDDMDEECIAEVKQFPWIAYDDSGETLVRAADRKALFEGLILTRIIDRADEDEE